VAVVYPPLISLPDEIHGLNGDATACHHCPYSEFTVTKKSTISTLPTVIYDAMIEAWDINELEQNANGLPRPIDVNASLYTDWCSLYQYYVRYDGRVVSNFVFTQDVDNTIIQEFNKPKPVVYTTPRVLTDLIATMESLEMNIFSFSSMRSSLLHTTVSPYIHIGTKINRTIYPTTKISIKGKKTRHGY
jgi:hypothetical protein